MGLIALGFLGIKKPPYFLKRLVGLGGKPRPLPLLYTILGKNQSLYPINIK
jgi:hypothetical protein